MAQLLTAGRWDWWPVDKVILAYFSAITLLELYYWSILPDPFWLLIAHVFGALSIGLMAAYPFHRILNFVHFWYPLPYVFYSYKEMSILIRALRLPDADAALAQIDFAFWGAHPTVWLERFRSPVLTEVLEIVYSGFVPAVLGVAYLLWRNKKLGEFRYYAFLIALGFLVSYVGYFLVPARGPRFLLRRLQTYELEGVWLYHGLSTLLDRIESAHYDCFPSGHTEMTILAWWGSRTISSNLFRWMFVYTLGVVIATVYLRYHYTVDVLAGVVVAAALIVGAPVLYRTLGGERGGVAVS